MTLSHTHAHVAWYRRQSSALLLLIAAMALLALEMLFVLSITRPA